jgi:hypothetical protein
MSKITESAIEEYAIELLETQGFDYIYGPEIAPDSDNPERETFEEVILVSRLRSAIQKINPTIPYDAQEDATHPLAQRDMWISLFPGNSSGMNLDDLGLNLDGVGGRGFECGRISIFVLPVGHIHLICWGISSSDILSHSWMVDRFHRFLPQTRASALPYPG